MKKFRKINVYVLPSKNKNNKYIELLITSLKAEFSKRNIKDILDIQIKDAGKDTLWSVFVSILKNFRLTDFSNKFCGSIVHIQWPTVLYGSSYLIKSIALIFFNIFLIIILKRIFRTKIVWTVHNFSSHDYKHPFIDRVGSSIVHFFADNVILQQKVTYYEYRNSYPNKKSVFIPHGNYINVYGDTLSRNDVQQFRKSLGFMEDDIVLLSLGAIAPYKKNEKIIEAVIHSREKRSDIKLLIIGKSKKNYTDVLNEHVSRLVKNDTKSGIIIKDSFVPDQDIPMYYALSDYSIFYYDKSEMTSGGIILSLSYGLPIPPNPNTLIK